MLHVDLPTLPEFKFLVQARAGACVSIYLPTTPHTQQVGAAKIELANLGKKALAQLEAAGLDKRSRDTLSEQLDDLAADDEFWRLQAHSLALLMTPHSLQTFRLPSRLTAMVQVSDRFHLKPLLRAMTFPNRAFVLALAEKGPRLIEVLADLPAEELPIKDLPKDAGSATGRASVNDRSPSGRLHGSEGQKVLLRQYARRVDAALRPLLSGREDPLILAAAEPLASIWRSVNTYPNLLEGGISSSPADMSASQLADAARPLLDALYAGQIEAFKTQFEERSRHGRATVEVAQAARAASFGAIETLLVDIDAVLPGTMDEAGVVTLADGESATTYGIVDEIAGRALLSGARVLGVRRESIPEGAPLAAVLRYAL